MNPKIKIIDDLTPEDVAMLQALYSRSPASVDDHLRKVGASGSESFMDHYYCGYGHKSIGDCGTTTIFIEGVTMLMAKAIQDWALYSGQESSTRYMDFSTAPFLNAFDTPEGYEIQETWRKFYLDAQEPVKAHLREKYPIQRDEPQATYDRAIAARSFDILRSFLPAGAMTNLSWHTNLRQAADHLGWLVFHPDPYIRATAMSLHGQLSEKYTGSFNERPLTGEQSDYKTRVMEEFYFLRDKDPQWPTDPTSLVSVTATFDEYTLDDDAWKLVSTRPKGVELPRFLAECGNITSRFLLDFGSYRDLQRHRAGIIRMPLLTTELGFNDWYLNELPDDLFDRAVELITRQIERINALEPRVPLTDGDVLRQNYIAMGFQVPCRVTQGLPALVYRLELRSSKTVHPSLRRVVHDEVKQFRELFPDVALYVDEDPDSWTVRRGNQTILEKR